MNLLNVRDLSFAYGPDVIFDGVGFGVSAGERVAVVGPNGCGKTTLLRILAGEIVPDAGEIAMRQEVTVGYLSQRVDFEPHTTPRQIVGETMAPLREAIAAHAAVSERLAEVDASTGQRRLEQLLGEQQAHQQRIQELGGWDWEHRIEEMIDRLGLTYLLDEPVGHLSGGQRRRVDLARVLLATPDLLLLDEPTNHIDPETVDWLEGWLKRRSGALLLVTHDRYFLERVVDRILEVEEEDFYDYPGNYETFMKRKLHRLQVRERTEQRQQKLMQRELDRIKTSARARLGRAQHDIDRIEQMASSDPTRADKDRMDMELAEGGELGPIILSGRGLHKSYGGRVLLDHTGLFVRPGDKIGVVGPNGCGKTTLLRILLGQERPDAGNVERGVHSEIGYLRQSGPQVDPTVTVYEALGPSDYVWVGDTKYHKKRYLERYLFDQDMQRCQVSTLSGGQRRRLALARLVAQNANVLVMDEPTNDLDILSLQALEGALEEFEGCLLVISHDRYFLNRVCNVIIAFEQGKLVRYPGNYDAYRAQRTRRPSLVGAEVTPPSPARVAPDPEPEEEEQTSRGLTYGERLELEVLEARIAEAEEQAEALEEQLAEPELYTDPERVDEITSLNRQLRQRRRAIDELYDQWTALEERRRK